MDDPRRARVALGGLAFCVVAPLAYLGQRLADHARGVAVDPLAMVQEPHVAYYWRCATAAWWGGLAAIAVYALAARAARQDRVARWLAVAVLPAGLAHLMLAWLWP